MRISRGIFGLVAVGAASLLVAAGCSSKTPTTTPTNTAQGSFADCKDNPNTCNSGSVTQGGTVTYTIEKTITGWNLNSANSNTFDFAEVLDGVLPGAFLVTPDTNVVLNTDMMVSADITSQSPMTVVYKIKPEAVWSDGVPIDVNDFLYAWGTGTSKDPNIANAGGGAGYDNIANIVGSDSGKTVTVTFTTPYSDWKGLFSGLYPAHVAQALVAQAHTSDPTKYPSGSLLNADGTPDMKGLEESFDLFDTTVPNWSGGPFIITANDDQSVTETPNAKWYGAVKPSLSSLVFRIITDQTQEVPALQNGEVNAIYPQPSLDIVNAVKALPGVQYMLGAGLIWEHLDLQTTNEFLSDKTLRTAIFTAIDRKDIISRTVGQFAPGIQPLNSHNFVPGQAGYTDQITATGQGSGDIAKAQQMLTSAGYTGAATGQTLKTPGGKAVTLRFSYTQGNTLREATGEAVQSYLAQLGIQVTLTPITSLGGTLESGDYDIIDFAWVGTPFPYSGAIQLWGSTSGSNFSHFVDTTSDGFLNQAAADPDNSSANNLLNQSDQILTAAAVVLPLYQKPTFLAADDNIANIRDNATSVGPPYNVQEWGMRAS